MLLPSCQLMFVCILIRILGELVGAWTASGGSGEGRMQVGLNKVAFNSLPRSSRLNAIHLQSATTEQCSTNNADVCVLDSGPAPSVIDALLAVQIQITPVAPITQEATAAALAKLFNIREVQAHVLFK